ncbi:hypothetical protein RRG08_058981 [Elysia crispata]|uniref:Uncharacterized protein n=1 Tax=Elysia crispata TaxID=231223 RepID=A0AAE1AXL6_9GAST|nr:hypothetical protein RRG08_058981 [Elysia crispata]
MAGQARYDTRSRPCRDFALRTHVTYRLTPGCMVVGDIRRNIRIRIVTRRSAIALSTPPSSSYLHLNLPSVCIRHLRTSAMSTPHATCVPHSQTQAASPGTERADPGPGKRVVSRQGRCCLKTSWEPASYS